ncbi:hypothetical protein MCERE10_03642 [Burkholderiaceae bacterium]
MKHQQPMYEQFFEEYAKLLRMRLHQYLHDNGGQAKFLNALIITPWYDDSCNNEVNFACKQVNNFNEWLAQNTPCEPELCKVFLDDDAGVCYNFYLYIATKSYSLEEIELVRFELMNNTYEAQLDNYDNMKFTEIGDEVWGEMLLEVKSAMSFGTLCLTEAN